MRHTRRIGIILLALLMLGTMVLCIACKKVPADENKNLLTVTFQVEGKQYGEVLKVQKGRRITEPAAPTFSTEGRVFTGWYTSEDFAADSKWNFATSIVTDNVTLYAGYRMVNPYVSDVAKAEQPVTSKLVFTQSAASAAEAYEVILTDKHGEKTTLTGTVSFDAAKFQVTFTPTTVPQGGVYTVSIKDTTQSAEAAVAEGILFCGAGTESNPYLIGSALDFTAVNQANVSKGTYFKLNNNITIETSRDAQKDFIFDGTFLGGGKTITLENSNCAAIYKLGENGYIYNVGIGGKVSTALYDSVGTMVDFNAGKVEKVNVTANVESTAGLTGSKGLANALDETLADGAGNRGIAGGVVGTNLATGVVYNCKITSASSATGTIKASIGGGTIVGLNYGKVELCISNGCLGAWNSKETGKTNSAYSYSGIIVGINKGSIVKCGVDTSGKLLAQRYAEESQAAAGAGTNNANLGGIAGYNMAEGTISECYFKGIRVHGDENIGGIAGLNAGSITNCYVSGVYQSTKILAYIGGRTNVGGIVGKTEGSGSVSNCYVTANVYAYGESGVAYTVAEKAENCVYLSANLNTKSDNDGTGNPDPVTLTVPQGNGNVAVEVVAGSADGTTDDYVLAESYLATVNGAGKFVFDTAIKLQFETEILPEETVSVDLYVDGALSSTVSVAETGAAIEAPAKRGYKFVGWALTADGEVKFAAEAAISLYDVLELADKDGKISLYAVYEVRPANEGLIVAIWERYITAEQSEAIKAAYQAYMAEKGLSYTVEFRGYSDAAYHAVADFGAAINKDGDIDVILGAGANITSQGGVAYIARGKMLTEGLTDRYSVMLTDTSRALDFFGWSSGTENVDFEITFDVSGSKTSVTLNTIFDASTTAPEVTAAEGFTFKGWATAADATEAAIKVKESISYSDVKDLLADGKVTLYPVFEANAVTPPASSTTLKVSVWANGGNWITDAELEAIKTGFAAYLTAQGIDPATVTINWVDTATNGNKVADLGAAVNAAGDFDIIIGCGANVTTKGGVEVAEKADILTAIVAGDRDAARITANTLAVHLYTYLTTAPAA